jgi:tripeptide aminopeptidase
VVVAAHLDTVFPAGTDVTVKHEGAVYRGPGIGDNCRGLAAMIGVVRALQGAKVETAGSITFVANVCEEGLGNLKGAFHLFEKELQGRIDRFVSIDGSGIGYVTVGVGSERYKVTFKGPGGHSYFAFGRASAIHAMGRAISKIAALPVPKDPRTTFNVGRVGGGTSVNSVAGEAWMELDMRSHDAAALRSVDEAIHRAVADGVAEENASTDGKGAIAAEWEKIGTRVPGKTPEDSPIVECTRAVTRVLGLPLKPFPATTDSNVAMMFGTPAVTLDGGGDGGGGHSVNEYFDSTDSWKGTQRALLLAIALTQP